MDRYDLLSLAVEALEKLQYVQRVVEVEVYKLYLDVWWEVQFVLDRSLLEPVIGC